MVTNLRKMVLCVCLVLLPAKMFGMLEYARSTGDMLRRSYSAIPAFLKKYVLFETSGGRVTFEPSVFINTFTAGKMGKKSIAQPNSTKNDLEEETVMAVPALKKTLKGTFDRSYSYLSETMKPFVEKVLGSDFFKKTNIENIVPSGSKPSLEKTNIENIVPSGSKPSLEKTNIENIVSSGSKPLPEKTNIENIIPSGSKPLPEKTDINERIPFIILTPEDGKRISEINKIANGIIADQRSFGERRGEGWKPNLNAVKSLHEMVDALLTSPNVRKSSWNNFGQVLTGVLPEEVMCLLVDMIRFDSACKNTVLKVLELTDFDPRFVASYQKSKASPLMRAVKIKDTKLIKAMLNRIEKNQKRNVCKDYREWTMLRLFSSREFYNQNVDVLSAMIEDGINDPDIYKKYFEILPPNQISVDSLNMLYILAQRYVSASKPENREKWGKIITILVEHGMPVDIKFVKDKSGYDLEEEKQKLAQNKKLWNEIKEEGKKYLLAHGYEDPLLVTEKDLENRKKVVDEGVPLLLNLLTSLEKKRGPDGGKYGNHLLDKVNAFSDEEKEFESFVRSKEFVSLQTIWTYVERALERKYTQAVRILVEKYGDKLKEVINMRNVGFNDIDTLLAIAVRKGNTFFIEWALKNGADPRYTVRISDFDSFGPLYTLAEGKYLKIDAMLKKAAGVLPTQQKLLTPELPNNKNFIKE